MLNDISVYIQQFGIDYPIVKYLAVYVVMAAFGILIVATGYLLKDYIGNFFIWTLERLLAITIMAGLIAWAAVCILFIFPFHCFKNRKVLMDMHRNKKRKV